MSSVTFGIPSYNNNYYCLETVRTIAKAMKKFKKISFEIIVIDDASTDNTYNKINNFKKLKRIKFLKIFKNNKNLGFARSCLKAAKLGKGKYFKIIHSGNIESVIDLRKYFINFGKHKIILSFMKDNRFFFRKFLSLFCTFIFRLVSGINIKYFQSAILCLRLDFIKYFPKNYGNFFISSLIVNILYKNKKFIELEIKPIFKKGSTAVSFQNLISFIKSIFSIIYLRVKYN
jgi:glycosyltransferase involved in cell wall biosynthesis